MVAAGIVKGGGGVHRGYAPHYEPRSKKCLNMLTTGELSNKSLHCLYKVSNQFFNLVSNLSQNLRQF